ncbi:MAG: RidA family protein [Comamonadaceae bacterium]|nr:MAG: RidA family protein [Comamonadaceae bacterium]
MLQNASSRIELRLAELGLVLPEINPPFASFQPVVIVERLAFVAGQPPVQGDSKPFMGRVGADLTLEQGQAATRLSGLNILAQLRLALEGDLDRVVRCVKLGVFVNSAPDFQAQPQVANGVSDMMMEIMGDAGRHARFAVGTIGPMGFACSVEAVFQVN